jgi:hypothetical protein
MAHLLPRACADSGTAGSCRTILWFDIIEVAPLVPVLAPPLGLHCLARVEDCFTSSERLFGRCLRAIVWLYPACPRDVLGVWVIGLP